MAATIEKMEDGKMSQSFLFSNEPIYINHSNSLFDEIWKNGIDAKERITHIEEGTDLADIEVIRLSNSKTPCANSRRVNREVPYLLLQAVSRRSHSFHVFFPRVSI